MTAPAAPRSLAARLALPALILCGIALGTSPLFVRISETGPSATGFWRMVLALALALALPLLWLLMRRRTSTPVGVADLKLFVMPGFMFAADLFFWQWAVHFTTMANATLFSNFAPVIVTAGAFLFLREKVTAGFLAGLGLALCGAALLLGASAGLGGRFVEGDLLGLASAVFYGGYLLYAAKLRERFDAATFTFWYSLVCALFLLPAAIVSGEILLPATAHGWLLLLGLAWISHVLGQGLVAQGIGHLPASFSSLVILVQPLVAAILAWVLLGEALGPWQVAGGIVVLAGIFVARRSTIR